MILSCGGSSEEAIVAFLLFFGIFINLMTSVGSSLLLLEFLFPARSGIMDAKDTKRLVFRRNQGQLGIISACCPGDSVVETCFVVPVACSNCSCQIFVMIEHEFRHVFVRFNVAFETHQEVFDSQD